MGKFLNENLPSQVPTGETVSEWEVENAFPNLTFNDPLDMREMAGGKMLVVSKNGKMWSFDNDPNASTKSLFLDISDRIMTTVNGNVGVTGAILHPEYGQQNSPNQFLYVVYRHFYQDMPNRGYARLSRFSISNGIADPNSEFILINQIDGHDWHNGGSMFFGPQDGFLYISIGDEGGNDDQYNSTQTLTKGFFGGILRIDVDRRGGNISHPIRRQPTFSRNPPAGWPASYSQGYYIPNDNPWLASDGSLLEEFYALGLRSPHRMAYDAPTGDIWVGEVGNVLHDEISVLRKGDNAEWPYKEAFVEGPKPRPATVIGNEKAPLIQLERNEATSVIGGMVYRQGKWSNSLGGKYIFTTHRFQNIYTVDYYNTGSTDKTLIATIPFLTNEPRDGPVSMYTDQAGDVFICQLLGDQSEGLIYKLKPKTVNTSVVNAPALLSQTGAFVNVASLTPTPGLVPFEPNVTFWSDGALKKRWIALPNDGSHDAASEQIQFSENDEWAFPNGTVFVKHFDLLMDESDPNSRKKIETRFTVKADDGQYYFLTYRWLDDESDAELVTGGADRSFTIQTASGSRQQTWRYPNDNECRTCHTSGGALGVNTRQMNGDYLYPGGVTDTQLRTMNHLNWFSSPLNEADFPNYLKVSPISDPTASLEQKALSYLDVNCSYCHQPGNLQVNIDFRYPTPLDQKNIIQVIPDDDLEIAGARRILPGDHSKSVIFHRMASLTPDVMMPPLAKSIVDEEGTNLIREWIDSLVPGTCSSPSNLALNQPARQSSTYGNGLASYANDGNTLGSTPWAADLQHTQRETQPWWEVDLGTKSQIDQIILYNRSDVYQNRLRNFYVLASDEPLDSTSTLDELLNDPAIQSLHFPGTVGSSENIQTDLIGRYVRIQLSGSSLLHMAEVEVMGCAIEIDPCQGTDELAISPAGPFTTDQGLQQLQASPAGGIWGGAINAGGVFDPSQGAGDYIISYQVDFGNGCVKVAEDTIRVNDPSNGSSCTNPTNLALNQPATQSSTYGAGLASYANDGNTVGTSPWSADLQHTQREFQPWWEVDLGTNSQIKQINLYNRSDAYQGRLKNFYLLISEVPIPSEDSLENLLNDSSIQHIHFPGTVGLVENLLTDATGRYVRVQLTANNILHMAEVEVMGCVAGSDPCQGTEEVAIAPSGPFTSDQGLQQLQASPAGGTWSGAVNVDGTFDPSQGAGAYELSYTIDLGNGCVKVAEATIQVNESSTGGDCSTPSNLALNQEAIQSSTYGVGFANFAVDGNTTGSSPWSADLQHTQNQSQPWWEVDLGTLSRIAQINLYNRTDNYQGRLKNFYILVSDSSMASTSSLDELLADGSVERLHFPGRADSMESLVMDATGRYVRIQLSGSSLLHMAEVEVMGCPEEVDPCQGTDNVSITAAGPFTTDQGIQQLQASPEGGTWSGTVSADGSFDPSIGAGSYIVDYSVDFGNACVKVATDTLVVNDSANGGDCDGPTNLALNQPATQSSLYAAGLATYAVDGDLRGSSAWRADLQHTAVELEPWWEVDLGQQADIEEVILYNRSDCCQNRLKDFYVMVSDQPIDTAISLADILNSSAINSTYIEGEVDSIASLPMSIAGRYVRIQLTSRNLPLHMAEVQVLGCYSQVSANRFLDANQVLNEELNPSNEVQMHLVPNPTNQSKGLNVIFELPEMGLATVELYDLTGKRIQILRKESKSNELLIPINISQLSSGMYLLRAHGDNWKFSKRVILE